MTQPTLSAERLVLEPLADEHLELEVELDSDPEVMRFTSGRTHARAEVEREHRSRLAVPAGASGLGFWVGSIAGAPVGWWLLQPPNGPDQPYGPEDAELGYRLLRRYWRRGLGGEGARRLVRYGFDDVGVDRIYAQAMTDNVASQATMRSVGMSFARRFRSGDHHEVEFEITRAAWRATAAFV